MPPALYLQLGQSPSAVPHSPSAHGAVRAAALAARHARQFRQKKQISGGEFFALACADDQSDGDVRAPSPVGSYSHRLGGAPPLRVKKHLNLRLDCADSKPTAFPFMAQADPTLESAFDLSYPANYLQRDRRQSSVDSPSGRRRRSSVTLSMSSPEAAEFREVAHDGPVELGQQTKRVKTLGKGAGGVVYLGVYVPALKLVAVKDVTVYKDQERRMVQHELRALHSNLSPLDGSRSQDVTDTCPYLVGFYGAYLRPSKGAVSIVMEFMDVGSVQDLLDAQSTVSEDVLRHAAFCCLTALDHMHSQRMVHRDIKPANILLNRQGDFKIGDFGLAGTLAQSDSFFSEFEGTVMYMAPERISGDNYDCSSDIWSLGVVLFYLATGVYPFVVDDGFFGLEEAICTDPLPPMPNWFSPECRDFMKSLLRRDPSKRLDASSALAHPFLANYSGSSSHERFQHTWNQIGLKSAINSEDVDTIAHLIGVHTQRYPDSVQLAVTEAHNSVEANSSRQNDSCKPRAFFDHLSDLFGSRKAARPVNKATVTVIDPLEHLANECGVSATSLRRRIDKAAKGGHN